MCYKRSSPANILIFSMLLTPTLLRWYFFTSSSVQLMPKIKSFILFLFSLHTINYLSLELHQLPHCLTKKVTLLRCSWQLLDFITIQRIWLLRISGLAINGTPQGKTVWKKVKICNDHFHFSLNWHLSGLEVSRQMLNLWCLSVLKRAERQWCIIR